MKIPKAKHPDQTGLKTYKFTRSYNVRVYEVAEGQFASDEEAKYSAQQAHFDVLVDSSGKALTFERVSEDEPVMYDLGWMIDRVSGDPDTPNLIAPVVDGEHLRPGYVDTIMLLDVINEIGPLDQDWPGHMRQMRAGLYKLKELYDRLETQED